MTNNFCASSSPPAAGTRLRIREVQVMTRKSGAGAIPGSHRRSAAPSSFSGIMDLGSEINARSKILVLGNRSRTCSWRLGVNEATYPIAVCKMMGSFITRGLVLIFGYAFPAYECYKSVEMNKPDIHRLRFWCQYWILVAGLTICEKISDLFIGWLPMYGEAKLAFFIYLWFPKTKVGTTYVYDSFFRPYVAKHETEIDRNLSELKTRAGDIAVLYSQRAASYVQTRLFDILQFIASQSTLKKQQPVQPKNEATEHEKAASPSPISNNLPQEEQPPPPSSPSGGKKEETKEKSEHSDNVKKSVPNESPKAAAMAAIQQQQHGCNSEEEALLTKVGSTTADKGGNGQVVCVEGGMMEENRRVTRARTRKTRASSSIR
ncbi:hypothetical protein M569_16154 [Genlisea aurea]|uniref:HVA22-like protein n=1 Tax=Genlisea aurea TaxID=192259 RepID=S8D7I1_9LAMI|nr:hypothetical protein M569_16154 [Genlisea aurea]